MAGPWEKYAKPSSEGPWTKYAKPTAPEVEEQGISGKILDGVIAVGKKIDSYTGAPTRAAIGAYQDNKDMSDAFADQFGANPDLAPTGKEIAQKAGVPDTPLSQVFPQAFTENDEEAKEWLKFKKGGNADITASGAAGLGVDVLADPTLIVPVGAVAKAAGNVGLKATKLAGKGAGAFAKTAAPLASKIAPKAANLFAKTGEALTAVPIKNIQTYMKHTDEINAALKKHGGDIAEMSDNTREGFNKAIQGTKNNLNSSIDEALGAMPTNKNIDISWIKNDLQNAKAALNTALDKPAIAEIDDYLKTLNELSPDNLINVQDMNKLKKFMQNESKTGGAYMKNGAMFTRSNEAARAAKGLASKLRKQINGISPEIAQANNTLSRLHSLEDTMNKNLLAVGKSENALMTAGAGVNSRNSKALEELGKITGKDFVGESEKLSAAKVFGAPPILPMDTTGKSLTRVGIGYMVGGIPGAVLTSPLTLKAAINAGKIPQRIIKGFGGMGGKMSDSAAKTLFDKMTSPQGQRYLEKIGKAAQVISVGPGGQIANEKPSKDSMIAESDLKGENKWALDGFSNLANEPGSEFLEDENKIKKIFSSKKGKSLLIAASELTPGSKAMNKIMEEIKAMEGGK